MKILKNVMTYFASVAAIASLAVPLMAPVAVNAQTASSNFCYTFSQNLGEGRALSSQDASALTQALTNAGVWTSGTPITTYNDSVASAVSGFQEKYASQILAPYGLSYGTGFIGVSTRSELNSLYGCSTPTQPVQSTQCPVGYTCTPIGQAPVCPAGYTCTPITTPTQPSPIQTPPITYPTQPTNPVPVLPVPKSVSVNVTDTAQYGSDNSTAFITTSIGAGSQNNQVTSWGLQIICPSGVTLIVPSKTGGSGTNICGMTLTFNSSSYYNVNQGVTVLTAGATNTNNAQSYVGYSLIAYDANGNNIGGDKDVVPLGAPGSTTTPPPVTQPAQMPISILTPTQGSVLQVNTPVQINFGANISAGTTFTIAEVSSTYGKNALAVNVTPSQLGCAGIGKGVCSYMWTPTQQTSSDQIQIFQYDQNSNLVTSANVTFSVSSTQSPVNAAPSITINGLSGTNTPGVYTGGSSIQVIWSANYTPINPVGFLYSPINGNVYTQNNLPLQIGTGTGGYSFSIPVTASIPSGQYTVQVCDNGTDSSISGKAVCSSLSSSITIN
jgi:hypothetical protein